MYKSILACVSVAAIAGSAILAAPAFADDLPAAASSDSAATTTSAPADTTIQTQDGQSFKADFAWSVPDNPNGAAYTTCDVSLYREDGSLAFSAPYPADLPKLTLQFGSTEITNEPIVPGTTGLSLHYICSNGTDTSAEQTIDSIAVPDVPPTTPAIADVSALGDRGLVVHYGGATTIGVSQLLGYQVDVDRNNTSYTSAKYSTELNTAKGISRGFSHMSLSAALSGNEGVFANLPAGSYTVKVRAFNSIGLSDAKAASTQIIVGSAGTGIIVQKPVVSAQPNGVRNLSLKATGAHNVKVSWKAPVADAKHATVSRYTVTVSLKGKTVSTKKVAASARSVTITKLKAKTSYDVRIDAYGTGNVSSHTAKTVKTKKH